MQDNNPIGNVNISSDNAADENIQLLILHRTLNEITNENEVKKEREEKK